MPPILIFLLGLFMGVVGGVSGIIGIAFIMNKKQKKKDAEELIAKMFAEFIKNNKQDQ